jgi:hypothetical protein
MKIVSLIWIILLVTILVQIYFIIRYIKNGISIPYNNDYSKETLEKTKTVIAAIENNEIKKHIITNNAPKYDSSKTQIQYKNFLLSELMKDILELNDERYYG